MANSILTLGVLSNELLRHLKYALEPLGNALFAGDTIAAKRGDTVMMVIRPLSSSLPWEPWDPGRPVYQSREAVLLAHQVRAEFKIDGRDMALSIDRFSRGYLETAAADMIEQVRAVWPSGATLVTASLPLPPGTTREAYLSTDHEGGLSIRCVSIYDAVNDTLRFRADMLFGFANVQQQYLPSQSEAEMIALLLEAKAELTAQLQTLKRAA